MDKLTITKLEKLIYRFLDVCKTIVNKHEEEQYFIYYTGKSLDFLHPYASCRLSVPAIAFDLFAGLETGIYLIRQTPKSVYELINIGQNIPSGTRYINFSSAKEQSRFAFRSFGREVAD